MKNEKIIVEAIQQGLSNSYRQRRETNLSFNNHVWVPNYNFIFSALEKIDEVNGLHVRQFQRGSYKMACVYDENTHTLYTICGANKFLQLNKRRRIDKYHYTDAYCLLSRHEGTLVQQNMFGEDVEIKTQEDLKSLLKSITINFSPEFDIQEYCILACHFNHQSCELYGITANYMAKNYQVIKRDKSWDKFIIPSYNALDEDDYGEVAEEFPVNIEIKDNFKIKLKSNKTDTETTNS